MVYDYKLRLVIRTPRACPWEQSVNENIALVDDVEWLDTEREKEMLDDPWDE